MLPFHTDVNPTQFSAWLSSGVNSVATSCILVGIVSQLWLRCHHPGWFRKYNYILGGALDGGAQVMVFILSFAVFGASGTAKPFPPVSSVDSFISQHLADKLMTIHSGLETLHMAM